MKAYDNKTPLLKSVLKTVMDPPPPGGLKPIPPTVEKWKNQINNKKAEKSELTTFFQSKQVATRWSLIFIISLPLGPRHSHTRHS